MAEQSFVTQQVTLSNLVISLVTYLFISLAVGLLRAPKYPSTVPWVGYGKGWVASLKNAFAGFTKSKDWLYEGYRKYSKNDQTFVLPPVLGALAETVIPRSQMSWMLDQPDSVMSTSGAHYEMLHGEYVFVKPVILQDPYHEHVVHKNLARHLISLLPELDDEVRHDVEELFGNDTEDFKQLNLLDAFMSLVPKITNRMLVGKPLCRNKDFLDNMLGFTMDVVRGFLIVGFSPQIIRPLTGTLVGLGSKYHYWRTRKYTLPLIKQRLHDIKRKDAGDPDYKSWTEPNDFITWSIRTAMSENRQDEMDPGRIAIRIMPINFASIHTTAMTGHAALLDILSSPPDVIATLREEAERIFSEDGGKWTKQGLSRMYRMDSAIRESQRVSIIALTFVHRKVVAKDGITSPEGVHFAEGTIVSCPWGGISDDDDIHPDAAKYDAFRFSRPREAYEALDDDEKQKGDALKTKQFGMVTTSNFHFGFGHGRHACPGRFFVSHELKMIFAHILLNYDIKNIPERPKSIWIGRNCVPASNFCIEVRRRKS